jgi:hypothetical protein
MSFESVFDGDRFAITPAKEVCPVWPGQPMTAHWGIPNPAAVAGTPQQIERAFRDAFMMLDRRISLLLCLPLASLDKLAIQKEIDRIGRTSEANPARASPLRLPVTYSIHTLNFSLDK